MMLWVQPDLLRGFMPPASPLDFQHIVQIILNRTMSCKATICPTLPLSPIQHPRLLTH